MVTDTATETFADSIPPNLPTGNTAALVGFTEVEVKEETKEPELFTDIETYAHDHNVLLSSDAIRAFMNAHGAEEGVFYALSKVIEQGKSQYPSEDGWLILNLDRMEALLKNGHVGAAAVSHSVQKTADRHEVTSLSEAIVTGDVATAYRMIAGRPMIALADAASDLDAIYRIKRDLPILREPSRMLREATANYSLEEIEMMIDALTTALDGTYTDEESAVKMAVMKAIGIGA